MHISVIAHMSSSHEISLGFVQGPSEALRLTQGSSRSRAAGATDSAARGWACMSSSACLLSSPMVEIVSNKLGGDGCAGAGVGAEGLLRMGSWLCCACYTHAEQEMG